MENPVFDELELIIFVSQGLTQSTASLVNIKDCCELVSKVKIKFPVH